jgi:hypothetical protein
LTPGRLRSYLESNIRWGEARKFLSDRA